MLKVTVLASGSKGNATLVESPGTRILIDSGLARREFDRRLASIGLTAEDLDAQVITHLHGDHVGTATVSLCANGGLPLYVHADNAPYLLDRFDKLNRPRCRDRIKRFEFAPFQIGDCTLTPFEVPHDMEANTCGLRVEVRSDTSCAAFAYTTDLGHFPERLAPWFAGCGALLLEFNHDPRMLWNSARPESVKDRIYGSRGHLSNQQAARALRHLLANGGIDTVLLAHMSAECNTRQRVLDQIAETVEADRIEGVTLLFAEQGRPTRPVLVKGRAYVC